MLAEVGGVTDELGADVFEDEVAGVFEEGRVKVLEDEVVGVAKEELVGGKDSVDGVVVPGAGAAGKLTENLREQRSKLSLGSGKQLKKLTQNHGYKATGHSRSV